MAKKKRLGTDPLSWIKDSRPHTEAAQPAVEGIWTLDSALETVPSRQNLGTDSRRIDVGTEDASREDEPKTHFESDSDLAAIDFTEEWPDENPASVLAVDSARLDIIPFLSDVNSAANSRQNQVISFQLNNEHFALPIRTIKEIVNFQKVTKLPDAPFGIMGVINIRRQVMPLVNLKQHLGLKYTRYEPDSPALVVQNGTHQVGILADSVSDVLSLDDMQIEKKPDTITNKYIENVAKVNGRLISILNINKLITQHAPADNEEDVMEAAQDGTSTYLDMGAKQNVRQFVSFFIQEDEFAVDIHEVQEIKKMLTIAHVPRAPRFVEGVVNLRGQIIPVINLRERFNLAKHQYDRSTRIIVIQVESKKLGLIVDSVSEVLRINLDDVVDPPEEIVNEDTEFVKGIAQVNDRLVILLDIEKVLNQAELASLGDLKEALQEKIEKGEEKPAVE